MNQVVSVKLPLDKFTALQDRARQEHRSVRNMATLIMLEGLSDDAGQGQDAA